MSHSSLLLFGLTVAGLLFHGGAEERRTRHLNRISRRARRRPRRTISRRAVDGSVEDSSDSASVTSVGSSSSYVSSSSDSSAWSDYAYYNESVESHGWLFDSRREADRLRRSQSWYPYQSTPRGETSVSVILFSHAMMNNKPFGVLC